MENLDLFLVLAGSLVVTGIARWRGWSAPLCVMVVALAVSFIPIVPNIEVNGELLLTIVLPPLLYSSALDVSYIDFRKALPQISLLGVGLVVATTAAVGLVAWAIMPELSMPAALLLGAIVAPPDAVSAAAVGRRMHLPRRVMALVSGESLVNDATSLTLFRVFLALVAGGTVTWVEGVGEFTIAVIAGVGVGVVLGFIITWLRARVDDPVFVGTLGLLVPFAAYALAETIEGSGVLSVVAMGLVVGFNAPRTGYATRQQERPVWASLDLLLNGFVFALIGLQLPRIVADLARDEQGIGVTLVLAGAVLATVLLSRPVFVLAGHGVRVFVRRLAGREPPPLGWRDLVIVSWAGMRGVVTLAAAAAVPDLALQMSDRAHQAIILAAFVVTVGTLLIQGTTLGPLIRRLGIVDSEERAQDARVLRAMHRQLASHSRRFLADRRTMWIERFGAESAHDYDVLARRITRVQSSTDAVETTADGISSPQFDAYVELAQGWITQRRAILVEARNQGRLSDESMRTLFESIDAEELVLDTRQRLHREDAEAAGGG